jgi:hypothetical protein
VPAELSGCGTVVLFPMRIPNRYIAFILIVIFSLPAGTSALGDVTIQGYIRETPIFWKPSPLYQQSDEYQFLNLIHTRQNLRWYISDAVIFGFELKTRLYNGDSAGDIQRETQTFEIGASYFDWEKDFVDEDDFILNSAVDRAWVRCYSGPLEINAGRQRIAWGTNLVWNPIDMFNPYSPLDFDNEEKPGADAIRLQYYLGPSSLAEIAAAPQKDEDETIAAGLLKINRWDYDWIFLMGRRGPETVAGFAWAGNIKGGGFRGEILFSHPRGSDTTDSYTVAAISGDYTFRSSLYLHSEILYNQRGTTDKAGGLRLLQAVRRGELTPARLSVFGEVSRDLSPLLRAGLAGIFNPYDYSWYLGPSATWSVMTDLDLTAMGLIFGGEELTEFGDNGEMALMRLKYSF